MVVLDDNFKIELDCSTYIALGSFDGLHCGHLSLIDKTIELSKANQSKSMVFTFKNHPLTIINTEAAPKLLMNNETKASILNKLGIDYIDMVEFDKNIMQLPPEEFVSSITNRFNACGLIVGFNYRFGYKNLGDVELLERLGKVYGFKLYVMEPIEHAGEPISSSRIRNVLTEEGNIKKATLMLSRPFMIEGTIIKGKQLGRKLGFPTINLDYDRSFVLPRGGVYYTNVEYMGSIYRGITNIGYNPTVQNSKLSVETFILDFSEDVYGKGVKIHFIDRIRDEKKFYSLEDLSLQLSKDKAFAGMQNIEINL
jgi:riboflavin kinase / FMN adenylyltransferase